MLDREALIRDSDKQRNQEREDRVPLVTTYHPALSSMMKVVQKLHPILKSTVEHRKVFPEPPFFFFFFIAIELKKNNIYIYCDCHRWKGHFVSEFHLRQPLTIIMQYNLNNKAQTKQGIRSNLNQVSQKRPPNLKTPEKQALDQSWWCVTTKGDVGSSDWLG